VALTAAELDLLEALATRPNRVLSRAQLLEFAQSREGNESERSVDVRITRLRRKLESDPDNPTLIRTVRGEGYMFVPDAG
jgi:two-component system phosphate regulon response regulator OmpR